VEIPGFNNLNNCLDNSIIIFKILITIYKDMRNRDTGVRRNSVLKNCTIVAFVLALALTICGIGAVWVFATHDKRDW
jgi:hypothetical protein